MQSNADFSVLIAVYYKDNPNLFRNAVESIFKNSLQPRETVIVADGPIPEEIRGIISSYEEAHSILFIQLPVNRGLAYALNRGIREITTKYIIRADSDDINMPDRFAKIYEKLESGFDIVGSSIREVDEFGNEMGYRVCPFSHEEILSYARKRNPFNHMSVGFRTDLVLAAGGYPYLDLKEDFALWVKLLAGGCVAANLPDVLVEATAGAAMYRRRGGLKYAASELQLQLHLVRCGLKKPWSGIADGCLRALVFSLPANLRAYIYRKFLRFAEVPS